MTFELKGPFVEITSIPMGGGPEESTLVNPTGIYWLNTFSITLPTNNLLALRPGVVLASDIVSFRGVNEIFMFEIVMCPDYNLATYVCRFPLIGMDPPPVDTGSFLMCSFSVVGFSDQLPKGVALLSGMEAACAFFSISSAYRKFDQMQSRRYVFEVKIVVKLVEYRENPGLLLQEQERALAEALKNMTPEEVQYLGDILERPGLVGVFSGRGDVSTGETRLAIIKRTARYARKLKDYMDAKREGPVECPEDIPNVINYLVNGEDGPLREEENFLGYMIGQSSWLPYLSIIARDYIMSKLDGEVGFLVEALQLSNHIEDTKLFLAAAVKFLSRFQEAEESQTFKIIKEEAPWVARAMIHSLTVFMNTTDVWIPGFKARRRSSSDL